MDNKMTFEQKLVRLDKIVAMLDSGEAGLEDSLHLFAEGAELLADCRETLGTAQLKIEKLFAEGDKNEQGD